MSKLRSRLTPNRMLTLFGLALASILFIEFKSSGAAGTALIREPVVLADEGPPAPLNNDQSFAAIVRRDPLRALEIAREDHLRDVRDYLCTFIKQEELPSGLSDEQTIAVQFRQEPYSVVMHWLKNPGKAERVIYVKDRWIDTEATDPLLRDMAVCQPGAIARLLVKSLKQPIRGRLAQQSSRRSIDEFGFARSLDLLIKYCHVARDRGELELRYVGTSECAGRPTWVIERRLPYKPGDDTYPDRIAIIHLDQEWRIPVSVRCYADDARTRLLGRYEYSDVKLGVRLEESVFDPTTYGM